ncbi:MAG: hypothetical protein IH840_00810 [Candidatus Heimdallarchaeota archaeon]|nr:hypothetical protein [Candidatus Heimdallarchaeota archaeon]
MLKIFVDTNVLLHARELRIVLEDSIGQIIDQDFELFLHPTVQNELIQAAGIAGKMGRRAKLALELTSQLLMYRDSQVYDGTDIAILESALRESGVVLTFDKKLRHRCVARGIAVVSNYKQSRLKLYGFLD